MIAAAPCPTAFDTATVIPRSLNEPVGLSPSYLTHTLQPCPTRALNRGQGINGVLPSPSEMTGVLSATGRYARKRAITPRVLVPCSAVAIILFISIRRTFRATALSPTRAIDECSIVESCRLR